MSRQAACGHCDADFEVDTDTGRLPSRCPACAPSSAAQRARENERRTEVDHLRHRVADLEHQLQTGMAARRDPHRPASRQTLAVAVRRVGTAQGRHQTAKRLHELAAEAEAWAAVIDTNPVEVRR